MEIGRWHLVHVHIHRGRGPNQGDDVECIFDGVVPRNRIGLAPHLIPSPAYVHSAVEVTVLGSGRERILVSHLDDVRFAATRPTHLVVVVTHLPEGRPQTVRRVRELDARFDTTIRIVHLVLRVHTSRRTIAVDVLLFGRGQNETMLTGRRFDTQRHTFLAVVLQLVVTAAVIGCFDVPYIAVQRRFRKIFVPNELVVLRHHQRGQTQYGHQRVEFFHIICIFISN